MKNIYKCPCAGSRRPILRVVRGAGLSDVLIQTAGQAAGKLAAQAPSVIAALTKDGQAALVPLFNQIMAAAPGAVMSLANTFANKAGAELGRSATSRVQAALANNTRSKKAPVLTMNKVANQDIQRKAQALIQAYQQKITGKGMRLSPY